jgi:hypothetical protein
VRIEYSQYQQTAASSKNANEFIDLLARFSTEYASVMKNEETSQIPSVLLSVPQRNSHNLQNVQNIPNSPYEPQTSPTLQQKRNYFSEPSAFPPDTPKVPIDFFYFFIYLFLY